MDSPRIYRAVVREANRASLSSRATRSRTITANLRIIIEQGSRGEPPHFGHDLQNAVTFMRSHRMYKVLLDRYNPLHDLTTEERIQATARRVGLDMPIRATEDEDK